MARARVSLSGFLAGVCIAVGGTVFLSLESKLAGALLFTVGLFTICLFKLHLFTGKVCYVFDHDGAYALDLVFVWLGNLAGTFLTALALSLTRVGPALAERAAALCQVKLSDSPGSVFILAVFCNAMIYLAVEGFNRAPHDLGRYLSLFFGVSVFILCGFEHCVANMYYFSMAGAWSPKALGYLLVMTFGNALGGVFFPLTRRLIREKASQHKEEVCK